ncbi:MAG: MarR family transcriptional regulator [Actinobacteria bacterium]|nr:MAG: MarR family transcriptional regulator [Actinomycetota bacterium]
MNVKQESADAAFSQQELAELALELRRMWHAMVVGVQHTPNLEGLQRQQFWVLGALSEGSRRMSDLAECAQTSQASLTGIVDRLEERGLVERVRSEEDRRVVHVALTAIGRDELQAKHARMLQRLEDVLSPLDPTERREFARLIARITAGAPGDPHC